MKNILMKIIVILITFIMFPYNVQATEENTMAEANVTSEVIEEKPTETEMNEKMYVQERCNIRAGYSTDSERVGGLDVGTEVTVVAEYSNGWYKINYDGGEAYIKSGILRSTKPEVSEENQEETALQEQNPTEETNEPMQEETNQQLGTENSETLDVQETELINEIGVLPEVGKNIADYLYAMVVFIAIIYIIIIFRKESLKNG